MFNPLLVVQALERDLKRLHVTHNGLTGANEAAVARARHVAHEAQSASDAAVARAIFAQQEQATEMATEMASQDAAFARALYEEEQARLEAIRAGKYGQALLCSQYPESQTWEIIQKAISANGRNLINTHHKLFSAATTYFFCDAEIYDDDDDADIPIDQIM